MFKKSSIQGFALLVALLSSACSSNAPKAAEVQQPDGGHPIGMSAGGMGSAGAVGGGAGVGGTAAVGGAGAGGVSAADAGMHLGGSDAATMQNDGATMMSAAPQPFDEAGCKSGMTFARNTTVDIQHDGMMRQYILHVPANAKLTTPTPLLMNFHGLGGTAAGQQSYAGTKIPDARGWIAVFPIGLGNSFNAGGCCSASGMPPHMANDADFTRAIIKDVASHLCIDKHRIYSTGMSNGGFMSEWNACKNADLFAAVAPVSALSVMQTCMPSRPISMISFNGSIDPLVSYSAAQKEIATWLKRNGCNGQPVRKMYGASYCDNWTGCSAGVQMSACTVTGMEHCWPGNTVKIANYCTTGGLTDIDANTLMFDFFDTAVLP